MRKYIQDIQPFNSLFFNNCFFNALFSILNYHSLGITDILVNHINIYCINKNNGYWGVEYVSQSDILSQLKSLGIDVISNNDMSFLENNIKQSLIKNEPVVVWIDTYYQPILIDAYNKRHLLHSVLINGFDDESKYFSIIEHDHIDSLNYNYHNISYTDLIKACNGYLSEFWDNNKYSVFNSYRFNEQYTFSDKNTIDRCFNIFKTNLLIFKDEVKRGLYSLEVFLSYINGIFSIQSIDFDLFLFGLNEIINAKLVQQYINNNIFSYFENSASMINKIIRHLNSFRILIVKHMLSSHKINSISELTNNINQLLLLEKEYYDLLFYEIEKKEE